MELYCKHSKDLAFFRLHVTYNEVIDVPKEDKRTEKPVIGWNGEYLTTCEADERVSHVSLAAYNGKDEVFGSPRVGTILHVYDEFNNQWRITAPVPSDP